MTLPSKCDRIDDTQNFFRIIKVHPKTTDRAVRQVWVHISLEVYIRGIMTEIWDRICKVQGNQDRLTTRNPFDLSLKLWNMNISTHFNLCLQTLVLLLNNYFRFKLHVAVNFIPHWNRTRERGFNITQSS